MNILNYIKDINILLVILDILFLIISFLFLNKKKISPKGKDLFVVGYTLINLFLFNYFNNLVQGIFTLKYLSVRTYLIVILINFSIFLYTFNKKMRIGYKLINYLMNTLLTVILLINIYIIISEKLKIYNIMDITNSITLMNISYIIFGIYLVLISLVYISYCLYDLYSLKNKDKKVKEELTNTKKDKIEVKNLKTKIEIKRKNKTKKEVLTNVDNNNINNKKDNTSIDNLLSYKVGESFYINGVDCSIIFCDSNKENIVKNYDILSRDINAKLVNGYTLNENIMIKDICNKLNINNLGSIDINNLSLLNIINVDEYMFLKKIFNEL